MSTLLDRAVNGAPVRTAPVKELDAMFGPPDPKGAVGMDAAGPALLVEAIEQWTRAGGVISFSRTSDGGAISCALGLGDWRKKLYAAHPDELNALLERVINASAAVNGQTLKSPRK